MWFALLPALFCDSIPTFLRCDYLLVKCMTHRWKIFFFPFMLSWLWYMKWYWQNFTWSELDRPTAMNAFYNYAVIICTLYDCYCNLHSAFLIEYSWLPLLLAKFLNNRKVNCCYMKLFDHTPYTCIFNRIKYIKGMPLLR